MKAETLYLVCFNGHVYMGVTDPNHISVAKDEITRRFGGVKIEVWKQITESYEPVSDNDK